MGCLKKGCVILEALTYEEFLERLGLVDTELSSLIYTLYQQALRDEQNKEDDGYGRIFRPL